jgi:hypothetical protein
MLQMPAWGCPERLGMQQVVPLGMRLPPFGLYRPLFGLPPTLGLCLDTILAEPYLTADPALGALVQLGTRTGAHVGSGWGGGNLVGRQQDPDPVSVSAAAAPTMTDLTPNGARFADTAASVARGDQIINVDSSAALLAAGMGKPVWSMLHYRGS